MLDLRVIYTLDKALEEKGQSGTISTLSSQVGKTGLQMTL
jgi:hypothetical protein